MSSFQLARAVSHNALSRGALSRSGTSSPSRLEDEDSDSLSSSDESNEEDSGDRAHMVVEEGPPGHSVETTSSSAVRSAYFADWIDRMEDGLTNFDAGCKRMEQDDSLPGISVTFKDVGFSVPDRNAEPEKSGKQPEKVILESCSSHIKAGSMVAIMGPSGCGKSTLLDILAKKKTKPHTGEVFLDGVETDFMFPRIAAYVDAHDTAPAHMTVREAVRFYLLLKGQTAVLKKGNQAYLDELVFFHIKILGLDRVADTKIGGDTVRGCSSGQRRRVTLAQGMVTGVPLLFCDEPTSGLSSTDAETCVKALCLFARKLGKTIFVVIHQPRVEVANLFDQLIMLTSFPGRVVYDGPMKDAMAYWAALGHPVPQDSNATDHYMDLITPNDRNDQSNFFAAEYQRRQVPRIDRQVAEAIRSPTIRRTTMKYLQDERKALQMLGIGKFPPVARSKFSVMITRQIAMVAERKVKLMIRNPVILVMQVLVPILEGAGLGLCFLDVAHRGNYAAITLITGWLNLLLMAVLFGGFTSVPQLLEDRILMEKEVGEALYMEVAHIAVGVILDMITTTVRNALLATIMYAFTGLAWSTFWDYLKWMLVIGATMDPIFKAAASIASDMQVATMIGFIVVLQIAVFNGIGFVTKATSPPFLKPLLYIMPSSRVSEQVAWAIYGHDSANWSLLQGFLGVERPTAWVTLTICTIWFCLGNIVAACALVLIKQVEK